MPAHSQTLASRGVKVSAIQDDGLVHVSVSTAPRSARAGEEHTTTKVAIAQREAMYENIAPKPLTPSAEKGMLRYDMIPNDEPCAAAAAEAEAEAAGATVEEAAALAKERVALVEFAMSRESMARIRFARWARLRPRRGTASNKSEEEGTNEELAMASRRMA